MSLALTAMSSTLVFAVELVNSTLLSDADTRLALKPDNAPEKVPPVKVVLLALLAKAAATWAPDKLLVAVKAKPPTVKLWPLVMALKVNVLVEGVELQPDIAPE